MMSNTCVIKLDDQFLYSQLPADAIHELLSDLVTRYEGFFTWGMPAEYPYGQAELLFKALSQGYGFLSCDGAIGLEVVDLRAVRVTANAHTNDDWKDPFAGQILASAFAQCIN